MNYDVRIQSLQMNGSKKGNATVTLNGQFAIRGVNVMEGPNGLFVSMPSWKDANNEYHDICFPCTKESRAEFDRAVLGAYKQAHANGAGGQNQTPAEIIPLEYDVRIHSVRPGDGTLKGTASVNLNDQFAIRRVSIMEGSKGLFVSTPSFKGGNGLYKDFCFPCTKESRAEFNKAVIDAYNQALTQSQVEGQSQAHERHDPASFEQGTQGNIPVMQM
jgi:stage V sporulation protein G